MTISEIKSDINFLCGSTSATYLDADKIRNVNIAYNDVARLVWESADGWQFDDSNKTDLPIATATLVHGQQDYEIPTTAQRLQRVEVKDSGGHFQKLSQIDIHDISVAMTEYKTGNGMPLYYDVIGRSVFFYPTPSSASVTLTNGLKVYVDRDVTEIATTASSASPGFAKPFHRILSYAASLDFVQDNSQRQFLAAQKARLEQGMVRFYGKRDIERDTSIRPSGRRKWKQYL